MRDVGRLAGIVEDEPDHQHSLVDRALRRKVTTVHLVDRIPPGRLAERLDPRVLVEFRGLPQSLLDRISG